MVQLVLYDRRGCHLCETARAVVEAVRAELAPEIPSRFETFDITRDPAVHDLYRYEIPVLEVDGEPVFRLRVDPVALRARLRAAGGRRA